MVTYLRRKLRRYREYQDSIQKLANVVSLCGGAKWKEGHAARDKDQ